ncbi:MAG: hypothetical protein INR70_37915 [Parafilimonas terrae]|jgi:hypothetical protein|nr:hypothetical protein [Parafilimonas terrae]
MDSRTGSGASSRSLALTSLVAVHLALPATAQDADVIHPTGRTAAYSDRDADTRQPATSDLTVVTRDVLGRLGVALPLQIQVVRTREVAVEAIKLFGLPLGATISDSINAFTPSSEVADVDITSWDLSKLKLTQRGDRERSLLLAVAAIWSPAGGGTFEVTSSRFKVSLVRAEAEHAAPSAGEPGRPDAPSARTQEPPPDAGVAPSSHVFVPETQVAPLQTGAIDRPAAPAVAEGNRAERIDGAPRPRPAPSSPPLSQPSAQTTPSVDPLVERARGLIRLGDISGARLLLERAQARNAPNATFLLAQTWDPAVLRAWNVRGLRADPDLARSLYAKAAGQARQDEPRLTATDR